jgi:hypothetical protein
MVERPRERGVFRRDGGYWTIEFAGTRAMVRDARGFAYLEVLLRRPGERVPVAELAAGELRARAEPSAERARQAVTKAIKAALARIEAAHPELGRHLNVTVRRGYFCSYTPDPRHPIEWGG